MFFAVRPAGKPDAAVIQRLGFLLVDRERAIDRIGDFFQDPALKILINRRLAGFYGRRGKDECLV